MDYPEERKQYIDGIACQYLCHIEKAEKPGNVFFAHFHYYIEMLYALSGHFRIYLNGIYHEFAAGDFVLINSREVHQIDALSSEGGSYIVVRFLPELIYDGMTQSHFELKYLLPFITENSIYEKVISSSILNAKHSAIPGLMNEIIRESEEKQYGYELAIKNHIGGIFLWLLRYWHANGEEPLLEDFENQQLKQQLSPALTYMITNYEKSISAADMAKLCNLSYSYFSRSFKLPLTMHVSDYLNEIRIREAEKLLVSTTQNVTEIASAVGFCTTSYFIKQFTKYLHISPKQYQKQMRQGQKDFIA